jgi:hypothetical protein
MGRVDLVGTTPIVFDNAFCNSLLVTENFMEISLLERLLDYEFLCSEYTNFLYEIQG